MSVTIRIVENSRDLRDFINFPETLYRHNDCYVPPLFFDQRDTLDVRRNPAAAFCESSLYLAFKDGRPAGRVAAIVNHKANGQWNHREVRFGWLDFIDDREVSRALMDKVEEFGRSRNMEYVVGPLGFTDFDPEGMLVEGYEYEGTMPLIYNHPYYKEHMEAMGFVKDADWQEFRLLLPEKVPERFTRMIDVVMDRCHVHPLHLTRRKVRKENYGRKIFSLINECYRDLYNFTVLPEDLSDKYMNFYLSVLDLDYVSAVENEKGELVAFGISMPSLARVLKICRGRLFPFGWVLLLWSLFVKHSEGLELLLAGVRRDYRNKGVNSLLFAQLVSTYVEKGLKWAETNAMLENNRHIQNMFYDFEHIHPRRRRSYKKTLSSLE